MNEEEKKKWKSTSLVHSTKFWKKKSKMEDRRGV